MNLPPLDCAGCTACCKGDEIPIRPDLGDQHKRWKTKFDPATGTRTLKRKANGDCVYLGHSGCTIHGKQPFACRKYDCRAHYLGALKAYGEAAVQARIATGMGGIIEGKRRVESLPDGVGQ